MENLLNFSPGFGRDYVADAVPPPPILLHSEGAVVQVVGVESHVVLVLIVAAELHDRQFHHVQIAVTYLRVTFYST